MHYAFGGYHLDTQRYELHQAGVLVSLRPKVFQVLAYLVAQHESREMLGIMPQPASPLLEGPCPDTNAER